MLKGKAVETYEFEDQVYPEELKDVRERRISRGGGSERRGEGLPDFDGLISEDTPPSNILSQVIDDLRDNDNEDAWNADPDVRHSGLVGLAFSGGGIRSATFNLGIMQALKKMGLFSCVDYLSTVSGGGYIGSCISSTLASIRDVPTQESEKEPVTEIFGHKQGELEPSVFRHLRDNANYLAPDGLRDVLRIPAILLRGMVVNLLVILPYLILAALLTVWIKQTPESLLRPSLAKFMDFWPVTALGETFVLTKLLLILLLLTFAAFPFFHMYRQEMRLNARSNWELRNRVGGYLSLFLVVIAVAFFIELQPVAIAFFYRLSEGGFSTLDGFTLGTGLVGSLVAAFAEKLLPRLEQLAGKLTVYVIGAIGVGLVWLIYIYICVHTLKTLNAPDNLQPNLLFHPLALAAIALVVWVYTIFTVDVNFTGIHKFYRDRLSAAYIIGLTRPRDQDVASGDFSEYEVEHTDKVKLSELNCEDGPYHLINTLLNLKTTKERYRSGRHGDFFLFSKRFIGGEITRYCRTEEMQRASRHVDLATAMAISGAAAAPNMGKVTVKPLVFILAMLNIRLNYWLPNPAKLVRHDHMPTYLPRSPFRRVGPLYLILEMFGLNTAESKYINLSDGGHIENLGVYELIRRQCRLIVAGDGEADPGLTFNGLAEVIRMVQIDFGIKIEVSGLDEIRRGEQHHAIGTIHYPNGRVGKLIYLKSSLLGDNNLKATLEKENYITSPYRDDNLLFDDGAYIAHYKAQHPAFPHESTGDQFFDEAQFECYRALGYSVAMTTLQAWDRPRSILMDERDLRDQ